MTIDNPVLNNIWKDRYQKNGESLEDNFHRVANYVAENEEQANKFYDVMNAGLFFPAGRTMSNAGIGENLTLNNCFKAGTKVLTADGLKNIENVKIGDMVVGADGKYHKVNNVMSRQYNGDIFILSSPYFYDNIYCTPNHQFLTQYGWTRADRLMIGERIHSQDRIKIPSTKFKKEYQTVDITKNFPVDDETRLRDNGDGTVTIERFCNRNRHNEDIHWMKVNNQVNKFLTFTEDVRYWIGRWIGDGSITRYKGKQNPTIIQIVFNATTEKEVALRCQAIGNKAFGFPCEWRETNQNIIALRWNNEILATWLFNEFGEKCDGKHIPDRYLGDIEIAKGLFDSDGCISTHGAGKLVLKNKSIIEWFRDTMFLNGFNTFPIKEDEHHEGTYSVYYSTSIGKGKFNKLLTKTYYDKRNGNTDTPFADYAVISNIEIEENQSCVVYNLSVEEEHSYVVNGVIAHNCFVAPQVADDLSKIFDTVKLGAITHKAGGGIGYDFSAIRPKGSPTSNDAIASGAVSFMEVFNTQTSTILQGNRRGANMGVMNIYHPDIEDFIMAKQTEGKFVHFNLSVMVDDDFMYAVKNNADIFLHYPVYDAKGNIIKNPTMWKVSKKVNAKDLWDKIMRLAYDNGEPGIFFYDNMNNDNPLYYAEKIIASNPCSEYLAGTVTNVLDPENYGGACNLGSLILPNFIEQPFTEEACINWSKLKSAVEIAVEMLDRIIDINKFPDKIYENYQKRFRTIGLGVTGLADALVMLDLKYDTQEARNYVSDLMEVISFYAYSASEKLAETKGKFDGYTEDYLTNGWLTKKRTNSLPWDNLLDNISVHGIRNAKIMSIAPTGTMSLTFGNNCSSGIEPIFSLEYERKVKFGGQSEENAQIVKIRDYAYEKWLAFKDDPRCIVTKDKFVTAMDMTVNDHVDMLAVIARNVDMSVSKTINIPTEYSFEDTKEVYMRCWKQGIKGCTIFRPNEIRKGILFTEATPSEKKADNQSITIPRGTIIECSNDLIGKKRKITTGCGSLHIMAWFDPANGELEEVYFTKGSTGGCNNFMVGLSRMVSLLCRAGVDIYTIKDQLDSTGACPSYAVRSAKYHDTSKGGCCPMAIGNALLEMYEEMQNDLIVDESDLDGEEEENNDVKEKQETVFKKKLNVETKKINYTSDKETCPNCGEKLAHIGGCVQCICGWSRCE